MDSAGVVHREVELAPLSGREEELLASRSGQTNAALVTSLLCRCVRRIGDASPITATIARNLLVADRQYLILRLRAATFGDQIAGTIVCPWPDCRKRVDIDFSLADLAVQELSAQGPAHTLRLSPEAALHDDAGNVHQDVIFRLPTGADQEIVAPFILQGDERAIMALLGRCILSIGNLDGSGAELVGRLSPQARSEIERRMENIAPRIELTMEGICPRCRRQFALPFDPQDFFFGELRTRRDLLYREVHYLAFHYHWSEREIMDMPRNKRRAYIEILADEIDKLTHVAE